MTVQVTSNNPNIPFIRGGDPVGAEVTIAQDAARAAALAPFTVMSKLLVTAPAAGVADAGNTGDGTVTGVAIVGGVIPKVGAYVLTCIETIANGGRFKLEDPDGDLIDGDLTMIVGAGGTTDFTAGGLTFTITDGATDFIATDVFTITTVAATGWAAFDATGQGGVQFPRGIYMGPSITAAAIVAGAVLNNNVLTGATVVVDENQVVVEGTATLDTVVNGISVRDRLAQYGIIAGDVVDISSYTA